MSKKRIEYLDVARGLAMISVLLGHLGIYSINRVIFTYHLPIFFFITGYFFSTKSSIKKFVLKKMKTLLVPYYVTSAMIILVIIFRDSFTNGDAVGNVKQMLYAILYAAGDQYNEPFFIPSIGALWFLWGTFWGSVFLKLLMRIKFDAIRPILIIGIYMVCIYLKQKYCWFPLSIQSGGGALIFIYLGYIFHKCSSLWMEQSIEIKCSVYVVFILQWLWFIKNFNGFWIVHGNIGHGIPDIIGSIGGCMVLLGISKVISVKENLLFKLFIFTGQNSIIFLSLHALELRVINWKYILRPVIDLGISQNIETLLIIIAKLVYVYIGMIIILRIKPLRRLYQLG